MADQPHPGMLASMFEATSKEFSKCFWLGVNCPNPAIRAHSIQNANTLALLEDKGHVISPRMRIDAKKGPQSSFDRVGRNRATTFTGLCSEHDSKLFAPIETSAIDFENEEHRFLLAYRSTFFEMHATAASGILVQSGYIKRVELGLDRKDVPTPAAVLGLKHLLVAWKTYLYKAKFDIAYHDRNFDEIVHDVRILDVAKPTVAASGLFSLDHVRRNDDVARVSMTILPVSQSQTVLLLSYTKADAKAARKDLKDLLGPRVADLKMAVSNRLLNHCSNFVLSPTFVASWTPTKRAAIVDLFKRTIFHNELKFDHPELSLFA